MGGAVAAALGAIWEVDETRCVAVGARALEVGFRVVVVCA
jgi:hypothetical protein